MYQYMTHAQKARTWRSLRLPHGLPYPESCDTLQDLREIFDCYQAAQDTHRAFFTCRQGLCETLDHYQVAQDACRQGKQALADEISHLGQIDTLDDFDLERPTPTGKLEGEPARLLAHTKGTHRQEGAAHVFSTWRQEEDPYGLPDIWVNNRICVVAGRIIQDNTMTAERAMEIIQQSLKGWYLHAEGQVCLGAGSRRLGG